MRYIGFDLGDGESAVAVFEDGSRIEPLVLPLCGCKSLISAVGLVDGSIVIGEDAYTNALANSLSVRFKSRFTTDPLCYDDVIRFAKGVLRELMDSHQLLGGESFVIGCPAGWNTATRARYRDLLIRAGFHEPKVISESRAAFLYAKYAKTVALDVDVLNESALVVDIGSSTLDYAYIVDGRETGVGTFGETALGGGILDAAILRRAVEKNRQCDEIKEVFREAKSWYSYCEIEARRLKEEYFTRLAEEEEPQAAKTIKIYYDAPLKLPIQLDNREMDRVVNDPLPELDGRSFSGSVKESLRYAKTVTQEHPPKLLLLTGGASRMPFFREACREAFPDALIVCCPEPEFSIAKGLAYAGWVDDNLQAFRDTIRKEITEERVTEVAQRKLGDYTPAFVEALTELLLEQAAIPMVEKWKNGEIETLQQLNDRLNERVKEVLSSPMTQEALTQVIEKWVSGLTDELQAMVDPICDRFEVPRKQMRLNLTTAGEEASRIDAGGWLGLPFMTGIMGVVVSLLSGLICGGTGVALIAAGPVGFLAGVLIGAVISLLGWKMATNALMQVKIPKIFRKINAEKNLRSDKVRGQISEALYKSLSPADSEFRKKTAAAFTVGFRNYLFSIAQAAEIPIT